MSSATSQGRGGGDLSARGPSSSTTRARSTFRGSRSQSGRGRGRGRGGADTSAADNSAQGVFRGQTRGTISSRSRSGRIPTNTRGHGSAPQGSTESTRRGRGSVSRTFNSTSHLQPESLSRPSSPAPGAVNMEEIEDRFTRLKNAREIRKKQLISDGLISDPEKKTTLDNAITPVGSCTDMCPELERIQRIRERATDPAERINLREGKGGSPSEALMVKRFRRSAAGNEEQLPEDVRTPATLQKTLNYLLDKIIGGGDRLATHQKYVWDRTRAIRNDFSIQQVTRPEDVKIAVDCYERVARFHILCLHLLSNEENTNPDEKFEAHQEREQLNNTLLSLMYYYDDNRHSLDFPNEAEFRAYCILFELQALTPDLEDRMQSWPSIILNDPRVQTARKLYTAAGNTEFAQGPLRPFVPASVAQANTGKFWNILDSPRVSYMMACVAEMNFSIVRFTALDAIWHSAKNAPERQQATMRSWTISAVTDFLGFDNQQQTEEFCAAFGISFKTSDGEGDQFIDFQSLDTSSLDKSLLPSHQIYSESIVETKRCHRTIVAVINGINVADSVRQGLVEEDEDRETHEATESESMFFPPGEGEAYVEERARSPSPSLPSFLNPAASVFTPLTTAKPTPPQQESMPKWMTNFGGQDRSPDSPSAPAKTIFGRSEPSSQTSPSEVDATFGAASTSSSSPFLQVGPAAPVASKPALTSKLGDTATSTSQNLFGLGTSQPSSSKGVNAPSLPGFGIQDQPEQPSHNTPQSVNAFPTPTQQNFALEQKPFFGDSQKDLPKFNFGTSESLQPKSAKGEVSGDQITAQASPLRPETSATKFSFTPQPQLQTSLSAQRPTSASNESSNLSTSVDSVEDNSAKSPTPQASSQPVSTTSISTSLSPDATDTHPPPQKRPSLTDISFPQVSDSRFEAQSTATDTSQQNPPEVPPPKVLFPTKRASQSLSLAAKSQASEKQKLAAAKAAREKLIEDTALIGLTQKGGILDSFIHHKLSEVLYQLFRQDEDNKSQCVLGQLKTRYLSRKYLSLWKDITDRRRLRKRADRRRKMLATSIQAEQDKQKRKHAELEEIIEASRISKQFQEKIRREEEGAQSQKDKGIGGEMTATVGSTQLIGRKRKSLTNSPQSSQSKINKAVTTKHKRSRTIGNSPISSVRSQGLLKTVNSSFPSTFGADIPSNTDGSHGSTNTYTTQRLDKTRTDYFRLKAMGVDPDTTLVPDTAEALALRQRRQKDERDAALARMTARPSTTSVSASPAKGGEMSPPPRPTLQSTVTSQPASSLTPTDPFLQQLREANRAMSEGAAWFKDQSTGLGKEIEELEERESLRRSLGSSDGPPTSTTGFARSLNGYEYVPPNLKPGQSLSRTEQRIRQTGARGLANKPIGENPIPESSAFYMFKRSTLSQSYSPEDGGRSDSRKRSIGEVDLESIKPLHARIMSSGSSNAVQQATKRVRGIQQTETYDAKNNSSPNAHGSFASSTYIRNEEHHPLEESGSETYEYQNGSDADGEVEYEEEEDRSDEVDEDAAEDEEEELDEESEEPNGHHYVTGYEESVSEDEEEEDGYNASTMKYRRYGSKATTNSASTPATAGPGASLDDAIELSD